ncbi:MAG: PAS domain S-box protein [Deltaproteobacteria bacterium]|nr:PAS domain S-box protein [Deltaproteobacteria bacterium]
MLTGGDPEKNKSSRFPSWRVLTVALVVTCVVGAGLYYALNRYMLSQAEQNIQNVLLEHKGIHYYIQRNTHPALYELKDEGEVPQDFYSPELLSSSYMLRNIHRYYNEERAKAGLPPIYYKMAAKNPRNPINRADELETRLIDMFNQNRGLTHFNAVIEIDGKKYLYYAVPFLPNNGACLRCHGKREDSPRQLQERYPGQGGFNEKPGEIRAIEFVRAPLQSYVQSFHLIFAALLAGVVALVLIVLVNRRLSAVVQERTRELESELTERQRAEAGLQERQDFLKTLVECSLDAIVTTDDNRRITSCNSAFLAMYGFRREEVLGRSIRLLHASDESFARWGEVVRPVLAEQGFWRGEWEFQRQDGTTLAVEVVSSAHRGPEGEIYGYVSIHRDVTERKRTEQALWENEQKFRQLTENIDDVFWLTAADWSQIYYVSPAFEKIWGLPCARLYENPRLWLECVVEEDLAALLAAIPEQWVSTADFEFPPYRIRRPDGAVRWISDRAFPIMDENGQVHRVAGISEDITASKEAEENRSRLELQLRQAHKLEAVGTLAGGIAHDFNNILAVIMGFAELAQDDAAAGNPNPASLRQILLSAERAKQLVRKILAFSRKDEPDLQPRDLNQMVQGALTILGRTLPKMIALESRLAKALPPVLADGSQIEQVLLSLASNSADAMPEGGKLTVETQLVELDEEYCRRHLEVRPGAYVLLQFSDTGHGMAEAIREHIFEPFYTTKEVGKGTGLGLSTTYGVIKNHGGHIYCYSEPGQGATFQVYLPVAPGEAGDQAPAPGSGPAREEAWRGAETILLVDDEEGLREMGRRNLADLGYQVLTAASGEEALEAFAAADGRVDLVIMDLGMPGMGGHQAMRQILAREPGAKVIIASGYAANGRAAAALADGAAGYVAKPFRRAELAATVREVLDRE